MNETVHKVNGRPCKDPNCWCKIYLVGYEALEDIVNNPKHYKLDGLNVEALDVIKAALTLEEYKGYLIGNMIKYLLRYKKKNNDEDIKKMLYYSKELEKCL